MSYGDPEHEIEHSKFPLAGGRVTVETFDEENFNICVGKVCEKISRQELYALLFFFGSAENQDDLVHVKETQMMPVSRLLTITANRDIKRGQELRFRFEYFIPTDVATKLMIKNPEIYRPAQLYTDKMLRDVNTI